MPILAATESIFPAELLDEPNVPSTGSDEPIDHPPVWWAIYTKSRQEKALARQLLAHEIPFYLPLVPRRQMISGRPYCSYLPLFTGYMFVYGTMDQRTYAFTTKRVSRILPVDDQSQLLIDLRRLRTLIDANVPLTVEDRLKTGDLVRVRHGAFAGLEGTVVRRNRKTRLLIAVTYLQQGVSIEIDDCMLEPL